MIKIILLFFIFILFYYGSALSMRLKEEGDTQPGESKDKIVKNHLKTINMEKKDFDAKKIAILKKGEVSGLNNINFTLGPAKKRIIAIKKRINVIDENVNKNIRLLKEVEKKYKLGIDCASIRIVALYKLQCLGKMHVILSSESINEIFRHKTGLELIIAFDKHRFKELEVNRMERLNLTAILSTQKKEKAALEIQLKKEEAAAAFGKEGSLGDSL